MAAVTAAVLIPLWSTESCPALCAAVMGI
ncbi:MAG: hypothetical protein RIS85_272, partial [Pseudomonadota bacterium]